MADTFAPVCSATLTIRYTDDTEATVEFKGHHGPISIARAPKAMQLDELDDLANTPSSFAITVNADEAAVTLDDTLAKRLGYA